MYANNVDFSGSATVTGQFTTNGQMLIGSTAAPNVKVGTIANGNNMTWTYGSGTAQANLTGTTNHAVQVGNASGSLTSLGTGSSGQVLQSGGALADPAYSTATYPSTATGTGTILRANGTNWVATTATYPNTAGTAGKVLISDGINIVSSTPTFPNASATLGKFIQSDGTNWIASTPTLPTTAGTSGTLMTSNGTNFINTTATYPGTSGTTGTILRSNGTNWVNTSSTYPTTTTANQILYSSATNTIGEITTAANSVLLTNASSVPSLGTTLANSFTYTNATAAANRFLKVEHTDNTSANSNAILFVETGGASSGDAFVRVGAASTRYYMFGCDTDDSQSYKLATSTTGNQTPSLGTELMKITSGGNRTLFLNSCVRAYRNAADTDVTGDGTAYQIIFDAERFDQNSNFNTTTGTFTAPVAGKYSVNVRVGLAGLTASHTSGNLAITAGGNVLRSYYNPAAVRDSSDQMTMTLNAIVSLTASQTITATVTVSGGTKVVDILDENAGDFTDISICLVS